MFWKWVALSIPTRILFAWINACAFDAWRCPVARLPAGGAPPPEGNSSTTGLEVIVASAGNSGSTSLHSALEAMGLRTHGTEDFIFYSPEMPLDALDHVDWTGPQSSLKVCRVQAVVADLMLMPVVWQLLPRSPDTKIVLLTRTWKTWLSSKRKTLVRGANSQLLVRVGSLLFLCHWLPYGLIWPRWEVGASFTRTSGKGITMELLDYCIFPFRMRLAWKQGGRKAHQRWFADKVGHLMDSEAAYDEFQEEIARSVPPGSLFKAQTRDLGWEELAALVGRPAPASGRLPVAKVAGFGKIIARMYALPARHLAFLGFSAASMATRRRTPLRRPSIGSWCGHC
mmetsp:Transcript_77585/g.240365  ORF Transcript_77585/g.240365 Transcript_77585/m.240365 type:complete len:341 (-) Transcript_77585:113-1135(-)